VKIIEARRGMLVRDAWYGQCKIVRVYKRYIDVRMLEIDGTPVWKFDPMHFETFIKRREQ
jgi:hypothetical protein